MAKYKIEIKKSAAKELNNLPSNDLKKIIQKIQNLAENPRPHDCKKLTGEEKYRIRSGDYRILYLIEDNVLIIYVVRVGHRRDVYR
jgi:mRNA interferase RelE/StbE